MNFKKGIIYYKWGEKKKLDNDLFCYVCKK